MPSPRQWQRLVIWVRNSARPSCRPGDMCRGSQNHGMQQAAQRLAMRAGAGRQPRRQLVSQTACQR